MVTRISGLASGMDIDQIVSDLMKAERLPLNKLKQNKQTLEWKRDDYRSMNTLFLDFRSLLTQMKLTTSYRVRTTTSTNESYVSATASSAAGLSSFSISKVTQLAAAETQKNGGSIIADNQEYDPTAGIYKQMNTFRSQGALGLWKDGFIQSKQLTTTENSKEVDFEAVDMVASSEKDWSITVNGVGYQVVSSQPDPTANSNTVWYDSTNKKLVFGKEIAKDSTVRVGYVTNTKTETLTMGKDTKEWNLSYENLTDVSLKIRIGADGEPKPLTVSNGEITLDGVTVGTFDSTKGAITFNSNMPRPTEGSKDVISLEVTYKSDDANYTTMSMSTSTSKGGMYNSFLIDGRESLNSVVNKVNSSKLGVNMFYDDVTHQMTMTRSETGNYNGTEDDNEITFTSDDQNSFLRDVLRFGEATVTQKGKDASFTVNGLDTTRKSNTFEMNGVTFTLKQTFDSTANQTISPVTINVNNDSSKVFDNIKNFVDKYNELIDTVRKKTEEERDRDYSPLTDDEREQLSDKQQEQWEEKAKSGLLRRDSILTSALSEMRMDFSQPVTNDEVSSLYNQLAKIGITTTANYLEGGKLEINEAKLKEAIENDPQSVENFFKGDGVTDSQKGVIQRLYNSVTGTMDKLKEKAGSSYSVNNQFVIGRELDDIDDRIDRFEDRLTEIEDRYYSQFTAMEQAIQKANSQMSYLSQYFSQ